MKLYQIIEQHWQKPNPFLRLILSPFSALFRKIVAKRRAQFLAGSLKTQKLSIPVIVIGNIHAGGTGKTPITAALVNALQQRGYQVGIISRGYGRQSRQTHVLHSGSNAHEAGDEPLMLFKQTHAPTAVANKRYDAGRALITQYPNLQMIICDDGLQHYALERDVEICVFPNSDVAQKHLDVLPNGSLREPLTRLNDVDFIVISNGIPSKTDLFRQPEKLFFSQTHVLPPYRFNNPTETLHSNHLKNTDICIAIAGIARPQRFFQSLQQQGFSLHKTITLPDHASIHLDQLPAADYIFITEKDAAKLPQNTPNHIWVLPIYASIEPDLAQAVLTRLAHQIKN